MSIIQEVWQRPSSRFILLGLSLYLFWNSVVYKFWLKKTVFSEFITELFQEQTPFALSITGHESSLIGNIVYVEGHPSLAIVPACNGLNFAGVLLCLVLAFPKPIISKLIFIPLGLSVVYLLNLFRLAGLSLVGFYAPQYFEFAHSWAFVGFIYGVVAIMCYLWMSWNLKSDE